MTQQHGFLELLERAGFSVETVSGTKLDIYDPNERYVATTDGWSLTLDLDSHLAPALARMLIQVRGRRTG